MTNISEIYIDEIENCDDTSIDSAVKLKLGVLSSDSEIRQRSFSKLSFFDYDEEIQDIFVKGLADNDELIRSDCIEYLAYFDLEGNIDKITGALEDASHFVVYSSIISLAELEDSKEKTISILVDKLKEKNLQSGIALRLHFAIYKLDPTYKISHMLDCYFHSKDYRDRCAILSLLVENCRKKDIIYVKNTLIKIVNPADFRSVLSEYEELLESLE